MINKLQTYRGKCVYLLLFLFFLSGAGNITASASFDVGYIKQSKLDTLKKASKDFQERKLIILKSYKKEIDKFEQQLKDPEYDWKQELSARKAADISQVCFQLGYKVEFARQLIRKIAAIQIKETEHPYYGNFPKSYDRKKGMDQNYATFVLPSLLYIYKSHSEQLDQDLQQVMDNIFERAHHAVLFMEKERIPVWYANVYLKVIGTLILLDDEEAALKSTRKFYDFTRQFGINEYGQWNYVLLQLSALQMAYVNADNTELKQLLKELLEFHWMDAVHNIHEPTMMYSFTSSRAKGSKGLKPGNRLNTLLFLYFGKGNPAGSFSGPQILLTDYQPPTEVQRILEEKLKHSDSFSYQTKYGRVDMQAFQTKNYSLATQTGRRSSMGFQGKGKTLLSSEENENSVQITSKNEGVAGARFKVSSARTDFDHYWISSIQHENKAIVSYNFDLEGIDLTATQYEVSSFAELGHTEGIKEILINGKRWDQKPVALSTNDAIVLALGETYVGIRFLENDAIRIKNHPLASSQKPITLTVDEGMVKLTNYLFYDESSSPQISDQNNFNDRRLGYLLNIGERDEYKSLDKFSDELQAINLQQQVKEDIHTVEAVFMGENDHLLIKEMLSTNMVLSRKINGKQFNNIYLLASPYASYSVGVELNESTVDTSGSLAFPPPEVADSSITKISLAPEDFIFFTEHLDDNDLYASPDLLKEKSTIELGEKNFIQLEKTEKVSAAFNLSDTDEWLVWVKMLETNSTDTLQLQINAPLNHYRQSAKREKLSYEIIRVGADKWQWVKSPAFLLHQGSHTLSLTGKSNGVKFSDVIITNDSTFTPQAQE